MQSPATSFLRDLDHRYASLHTRKEDAFWSAYMGLAEDRDAARSELGRCEVELGRFLQDPGRLAELRAVAGRSAATASEDERTALEGWRRMLECHVVESAEARALHEEIVAAEGALARARGDMRLGFERPGGGFEAASSVRLAAMIATDSDEARRRAAWRGLRSIEPFVLEAGFLEIVRKRNRYGRMLGGEDYYDATVRRVEGLTKDEIFAWLGDLEERTRDSARRFVEDLRARHGAGGEAPWNVRWFAKGDVTVEQDPYFPFSKAVERWGRSFAALGIGYRGARLVLDLVDRPGKYENGFMHGPELAWREGARRHAARIQFTANAIPGMVGAGRTATRTLFHEGGHAAHFANIDMPSPCFAQEFAPTSVAFAETQSMFLDSLLADADWQARYARTRAGEAMPLVLIEKGLRAEQPAAAWSLRAMLVVCFAEKAIYEIPDEELTPERALAAVRDVERRLLFLDEGSPRPVLAVPHLLSGESSAYYHGYVLAQLAVDQTRAFFLERDGHLVDNPRIGPDLAAAYWTPGNSRTFARFVESLTGRPLSAEATAREVNRTADEAIELSRHALRRLESVPQHDGPVDLDASIRIAHGRRTVAELDDEGFEAFARRFEAWIGELEAARPSD